VSSNIVLNGVAVVGGILTALLGILKYFNYRSKSDVRAAVGTSFRETVDRIASDNYTVRMTGAVLLRRFFDEKTEQGAAGTPYVQEAVHVIAGLLRAEKSHSIRKALADGLHYANDLRGADLQNCHLEDAYIGTKAGEGITAQSSPRERLKQLFGWRNANDARPMKRRMDLSGADLFESDCTRASFRDVIAVKTVFYRATLKGTVLVGADCQYADFREADLSGCKLAGAKIGYARFAGAQGVPGEVAELLDENLMGRPNAEVPEPA
jgi:uncharacterized protein YjbI with pentapeptide repeats